MDIYLKEHLIGTDFFFDTVVENNDIKKDDSYITASILSIFTDASKRQIGTQIDGKTVGNKEYNLDKLSDENIKKNEEGLREALQWLLDDEVVSKIDIVSIKNGNRLDRTITFHTNNENKDNLIYSLDDKFSILTWRVWY